MSVRFEATGASVFVVVFSDGTWAGEFSTASQASDCFAKNARRGVELQGIFRRVKWLSEQPTHKRGRKGAQGRGPTPRRSRERRA